MPRGGLPRCRRSNGVLLSVQARPTVLARPSSAKILRGGLSACADASSFRVTKDSDIARNGEKSYSASVKTTESNYNEVLVKFEKGKKSVIADGKKIEDRKDLLSIVPCIVFCHEDMDFVSGTPEQRRWFFDQVLSLYDPVYLDDLRNYRHILKSRNKLLRDFSQSPKELTYEQYRKEDTLVYFVDAGRVFSPEDKSC